MKSAKRLLHLFSCVFGFSACVLCCFTDRFIFTLNVIIFLTLVYGIETKSTHVVFNTPKMDGVQVELRGSLG